MAGTGWGVLFPHRPVSPAAPRPCDCPAPCGVGKRGLVETPMAGAIPIARPNCPAKILSPLPAHAATLPPLFPHWTGSRANGSRGQDRVEGVAPSLPKFRPAGCSLGGEGRHTHHGRLRAARGQNSPRGVGVPARKRPEPRSVDLDRGDKPPPSGGRVALPSGGQALRFRGNPAVRRSEVEIPGRCRRGEALPLFCGRPLGAQPRRRSPLPDPSPEATRRRALQHAHRSRSLA